MLLGKPLHFEDASLSIVLCLLCWVLFQWRKSSSAPNEDNDSHEVHSAKCVTRPHREFTQRDLPDALELESHSHTAIWPASGALVPCSLEGWELVRQVDGLRLYTRTLRLELHFRFVAEVATGVAELLCIPREIDLAPTWNRFAGDSGILELHSNANLDAYATVVPPWPLPAAVVVFNAVLHDTMAQHSAYAIVAGSVDRDLPAHCKSAHHRRLPVLPSLLQLTPIGGDGSASDPTTKLDMSVALDLAKLRSIRQLAPPWLIKSALYVMLPFVWGAALRLLSRISDRTTPLGARLQADATGIYATVRKGARQLPADDGRKV